MANPTTRELLDAVQLLAALRKMDIPVPPKHAEATAKAEVAVAALMKRYAAEA